MTEPAGPSVYILYGNTNHLRILWPVAERLRASDIATHNLIEGDAGRSGSVETFFATHNAPLERVSRADLDRHGQAGDTFVLPVLGKSRAYIDALAASGRRLVQVMEAARAADKVRTDPRVPLLGWGAASGRSRAAVTRSVGSPVLEEMAGRGRATPEGFALINAKFSRGVTQTEGVEWLEAALAACARARVAAVVSAHRAGRPAEIPGPVSQEPVADLVRRASVVLSRPSTVVFEALVIGVPVVLVPGASDRLVEFGKPRGAFPILRQWDGAHRVIRALALGRETRDPTEFLRHNVDQDPSNPSVDRLTEALLDMVHGRWPPASATS